MRFHRDVHRREQEMKLHCYFEVYFFDLALLLLRVYHMGYFLWLDNLFLAEKEKCFYFFVYYYSTHSLCYLILCYNNSIYGKIALSARDFFEKEIVAVRFSSLSGRGGFKLSILCFDRFKVRKFLDEKISFRFSCMLPCDVILSISFNINWYILSC